MKTAAICSTLPDVTSVHFPHLQQKSGMLNSPSICHLVAVAVAIATVAPFAAGGGGAAADSFALTVFMAFCFSV